VLIEIKLLLQFIIIHVGKAPIYIVDISSFTIYCFYFIAVIDFFLIIRYFSVPMEFYFITLLRFVTKS